MSFTKRKKSELGFLKSHLQSTAMIWLQIFNNAFRKTRASLKSSIFGLESVKRLQRPSTGQFP